MTRQLHLMRMCVVLCLAWRVQVLAPGFPLPSLDGIELINTHLQSGEGYIEVTTDMVYTGSSSSSSSASLGGGLRGL